MYFSRSYSLRIKCLVQNAKTMRCATQQENVSHNQRTPSIISTADLQVAHADFRKQGL